ncbi:hypothetical protein GCM10007242_14090 [Pigmentiphaga litoralis]|jgi:hypothetical protein|uniref:sensory rhodopsin transducer n=1 Tax=Pigmentiphaga litoralis TaxID=516702 RepID=UPI0016790032|nr:sensory rhodopsin transducer [Pigmentiphaga litoralis]GGX09311.1 hypothetical protein GCM10007242_14090 [Pigmentiphaga litoralis]
MEHLGKTTWVIAEGYIPPGSTGSDEAFISHETACMLNTGDAPANVEVTLFFSDRDPVGPYRMTIAPRRTLHMRFNDLTTPETVPLGTDYASVIRSDVPIVVQHTRLDSRQAELAIMTTMAWPAA